MVVCRIARDMVKQDQRRSAKEELDTSHRHLFDWVGNEFSPAASNDKHDDSHCVRLYTHGRWTDTYN